MRMTFATLALLAWIPIGHAEEPSAPVCVTFEQIRDHNPTVGMVPLTAEQGVAFLALEKSQGVNISTPSLHFVLALPPDPEHLPTVFGLRPDGCMDGKASISVAETRALITGVVPEKSHEENDFKFDSNNQKI